MSEKRYFVEGLAAEAECVAGRGELSTVYQIYNVYKHLYDNYTNHSASVKGKYGSTIATERAQVEIWVEHFCEVLNHPQSDEPAEPPPALDNLIIDTRPPTEAEVKNVIKCEETTGIDCIHADILKADLRTTTRIMTELSESIWYKETIPSNWVIVFDPIQSAYRPHHTNEAALVRINDGIMQALDRRKGVTLVLLDLTAAFDSVNLGILLKQIKSIGICESALAWIASYLSDRTLAAKIEDAIYRR